jgi:Protein of unknown function (DUF3187)
MRRPAAIGFTFPIPLAVPVVLVVAASLLAGAPRAVVAQRPSLGPLGAEEGSPLQMLGYTPMIEAPEPVARGKVRVDFWLGYTNLFERDSSVLALMYLDTERMVTATTVRYGLARHLEVGVRATTETDWGGFLDRFMVSFHDVLHLGTRYRRDFPNGQYHETLQDAQGTMLLDVPRARFALDDVRLFAKWGLTGRRGALSVRAVTRIPTRTLTVGSEHTDVAGEFMGRVAWGRWYLHGMAGGATVQRGEDTRDVFRAQTWFGMLGVERPLRERLSAVIEFQGQTQLLRDFYDHDISGAPLNTIFGVVGLTKGGWRWEAGMQ